MPQVNIYAHGPSDGATLLAETLGIKKIKRENSKYVGRPDKIVINWGASRLPDAVGNSRVLNAPVRVASVSNKLRFFETVAAAAREVQPRVPEHTTSAEVVRTWLAGGAKVVCRATLNGHSGEGITIIEGAEVDIPNVPLYTKYVPKKQEWRIHVLKDGDNLTVIDTQKKMARRDFEGTPNWQVRNHENGFIYAREVDPPHPDILEQALKALKVSGLDFGAVDVIYNEQQGAAYVLEINSAPGITGQTVESYANAFRRYL